MRWNMNQNPDEFPLEIDCQTVKSMKDAGKDFLLLDCRDPDEYEKVHLDGAKFIPMEQLSGRVVELEPYRQRPIVVHCHFGGRSLQVTEWLRSQGFAKAQNMSGGIDAWATQIDPNLPRY